MNSLVHSATGMLHLTSAIGAMVIATIVLVIKKGTRIHRFFGYMYFYLMLTMNGTAFMIYGLYGTFGPFHVAALASLITLIVGLIPVLRRKPAKAWLIQHFTFMYYSIVGLYAAFASETLTRIPKSPFYGMVIVATITITLIGVIIHKKMKPEWENHFRARAR